MEARDPQLAIEQRIDKTVKRDDRFAGILYWSYIALTTLRGSEEKHGNLDTFNKF